MYNDFRKWVNFSRTEDNCGLCHQLITMTTQVVPATPTISLWRHTMEMDAVIRIARTLSAAFWTVEHSVLVVMKVDGRIPAQMPRMHLVPTPIHAM